MSTELLFFAVVIGLWAWLFTGTLTYGDHIFAHFGRLVDGREIGEGSVWQTLLYQYVRCPICHAGALSILYVLLSCLLLGVTDRTAGALFATPVVAMTVAKVMSKKY